MFRYIPIFLVVILLAGCAPGIEFSRRIWGSSTRDLQEARVNGIVRIYEADTSRCFDEALTAAIESDYDVFIKDKAKQTIVLMGIKGSVNTTRVGVFFSEVEDKKTKIYISSLSSNAKRIVAEKIYSKLDAVLGISSNQAVTVISEK